MVGLERSLRKRRNRFLRRLSKEVVVQVSKRKWKGGGERGFLDRCPSLRANRGEVRECEGVMSLFFVSSLSVMILFQFQFQFLYTLELLYQLVEVARVRERELTSCTLST